MFVLSRPVPQNAQGQLRVLVAQIQDLSATVQALKDSITPRMALLSKREAKLVRYLAAKNSVDKRIEALQLERDAHLACFMAYINSDENMTAYLNSSPRLACLIAHQKRQVTKIEALIRNINATVRKVQPDYEKKIALGEAMLALVRRYVVEATVAKAKGDSSASGDMDEVMIAVAKTMLTAEDAEKWEGVIGGS